MFNRDSLLQERQSFTEKLLDSPYSAYNYLERAKCHRDLGFPDLAAGDAYRALLLTDEIQDESGEYHEKAVAASKVDGVASVATFVREIYVLLSKCLFHCGCKKSAFEFCARGLRVEPDDAELQRLQSSIVADYREKQTENGAPWDKASFKPLQDLEERGFVRRELYTWNDMEPDRYSAVNLKFLNDELAKVAPKVSAKAVELPMLFDNREESSQVSKQLGLFANTQIEPGEVLLEEYSLLTANNRLNDPLCDACSVELPPIGSQHKVLNCPECDVVVFCSSSCLEAAMSSYHPAVCGTGVDAISRDSDSKEAADALYLLLVGRAMAMAETRDVHPLELKEVKFLWGDFEPGKSASSLPFTFKYNILYPLNILEKMDVDIFQTLARYDLWIFNTLFAKFRGVASGRVNPSTGVPEVCAVHPLWCLANHSCAPNVRWKWGGTMKFWARSGEELVRWGEGKKKQGASDGVIEKGAEILNHYCDVDLDVRSRREWASGALGGKCICPRCLWEAGEANQEK